jgi:DNA-binding transcriptional MerR regulator
MREPRLYSVGEASRLLGIPYTQIYSWTASRSIVPTVEGNGRGHPRTFSFTDLVALRIAKELRECGGSLDTVQRVVQCLRQLGDLEHDDDLSIDCFLVVRDRIRILNGEELRKWLDEEHLRHDFFDLACAVSMLRDEIAKVRCAEEAAAA